MPEAGDVAQWDFATLLDWWNRFILPAALVVVTLAVVIHRRHRPASTAKLDAAGTIRCIGLIHLVLGLRALLYLTQEVQTLRTMGIFQSNPVSNFIAVLAVLVNPLLGIGLWRLHRGARCVAIVWYALLSLVAAGVIYWIWYYRAPVGPADWPDHVIGRAMPWFLLFVMLRPQTRRLFSSRRMPKSDALPEADQKPVEEGEKPQQKDWPIVGTTVVLLLLIACSTFVVDAADWIWRTVGESDIGSPN